MKISILDWSTVSSSDISADIFKEFGDVNCIALCPPERTAELIGDSEIVLCNKVLITDEVMEKCSDLKYIGLFATGFNNIDIESAKRHGVTVCNAGDYSTYSVAQQVFAYMLHYCSKIETYDRFVKDGGWENSETFSKFPFRTSELYGKTLSVIGFGNIGRRTAEIGSAFGMNVIVNSRSFKPDCPYEQVSIEQAFERADFLSVHCPLNEQSADMVNKERIALMKKTAVIINTSRGGTVDEQALSDALNNGSIAAAYLDVLKTEPMSHDTPLKNAKNCIITPHTAWAPLETRLRLVDIVKNNIKAYLDGSPVNKVN